MKRYTLQIQNESLASKVVWLLNHFKGEGLTIKEVDDTSEVKASIKQSVHELNMVKTGKLEAQPVSRLLNAL